MTWGLASADEAELINDAFFIFSSCQRIFWLFGRFLVVVGPLPYRAGQVQATGQICQILKSSRFQPGMAMYCLGVYISILGILDLALKYC